MAVVSHLLRRLCDEIGWSYAVFWKPMAIPNQPLCLVCGDGYCGRGVEHQVGLLVSNISSQVHVAGEGMVGNAALTGNHQWIVNDILCNDGSSSKVALEMDDQFLAHIQTTVIIPVLPQGVLQLGSTQAVMENVSFVITLRTLFSQLSSQPGTVLSHLNQKGVNQQGRPQSITNDNLQNANLVKASSGDNFYPSSVVGNDTPGGSQAVTAASRLMSSHLNENMPYIASNSVPGNQCVSTSEMTFVGSTCPQICDLVTPSSSLGSEEAQKQLLYSNPISVIGKDVLHQAQKQLLYSNPMSVIGKDVLHHDKMLGHLPHSVENAEPIHSLTLCEDDAVLMSNKSLKWAKFKGGNGSDTLHHNSCSSITTLQDFVFPKASGKQNASNSRHKQEKWSSISDEIMRTRPSFADFSAASTSQLSYASCSSLQEQSSHEPEYEATLPIAETVVKDDCLPYESALICAEYDLNRSCTRKNDACFIGHHNDSQCTKEENKYLVSEDRPIMDDSFQCSWKEMSQNCLASTSGDDLIDMLGPKFYLSCGTSSVVSRNFDTQSCDNSTSLNPLSDVYLQTGMSEAGGEQLLDAVVSSFKCVPNKGTGDNVSCKTSLSHLQSSLSYAASSNSVLRTSEQNHDKFCGIPDILVKKEMIVPPQHFGRLTAEGGSSSQSFKTCKSQISLWIDKGDNMTSDSVSASNSKSMTPNVRMSRKRCRPGENPRPRPKDRQLIQDRMKELREIVPHGEKCSIDALLEKTIKHMLFLQSVTKHAEKLKDSGDSKIVGTEDGLVVRDHFGGGTTWAFQVGTQSLTCPIIVEDLKLPRQMLVEMLCEDRGIFLEIADFIRGLGLTILKGVLEVRKSKIWARFSVEANRDVTRMEIFIALVHFLDVTVLRGLGPSNVEDGNMLHSTTKHMSAIPTVGSSGSLP